jgi:hypothetical protein
MTVYGLWQLANGAGAIHDCQKLAAQLHQLTASDADEELRLQAHHSGWATCLFAGEPAAAFAHSEAGRLLYDPERHRHHRHIYGGHDPGLCSHYLGAQALWTLGIPIVLWRFAQKLRRWVNGSLIRSVGDYRSNTMPCFVWTAASPN